ncbi:50S ribosomal protein L15e [[Eubacterium] cellulosolvens]
MSLPNKSEKVSQSRGKQRKQTMRQFAFEWRREPAIMRVEKPTRIDRAKRLGYKAKQGFVVIRARIRRSGARKKRPSSGRRQKAMGVTKIKWNKSLQQIAEGRVARKYPNMEVLNSYFLWADGKYFWTEVLLIDPHHPSVMNDSQVNWISKT